MHLSSADAAPPQPSSRTGGGRTVTVLGTRPEIIRLSLLIERLDAAAGEHILVHTGQNNDRALSDVFFQELGVRAPDHHLGLPPGTLAQRVGAILTGVERLFEELRPDRLLVLGDTDSGLAAFIAKRRGVPVFHMEAGNRCFDDRVPEEVNRRVIDQCSDVLLPYTEGARENLLREGIGSERIRVTGNPIHEVLEHHRAEIDASTALDELGLDPGGYLLLTAHRQETVDVESRLCELVEATSSVARDLGVPVICSVHPRTRSKLESFDLSLGKDGVRALPPFGFFDFVALERGARIVLTDSGTVQEECCLLGVPAVTIRDTTERPETIACGSNVLSGVDPGRVRKCVASWLDRPRTWTPPPEYLVPDVSMRVARIVT
jgi:UDP-N-acetylglucosamine 2-epimerase (non-hydrolysing)